MNKVKSPKKSDIIILEGVAGIDNALAIKDQLVNAVNHNHTVEINVERLENADIAVLQLLYATFQHCAQINKSFKIYSGNNQVFKSILRNSGYADFFQLD